MRIKIFSWNIWYKESLSNIDSIIKEINKYNPDIICLQEVNEKEDNRVIDYLLSKFNDGRFALADVTSDKRIQGNAILTKHKIVNSESFYIVDRSNQGDYSKEGRVYLECELDIDGKTLFVATTHSSYTHKFMPTLEKDKEIDKLLELLKRHKNDFVFAGDLNTTYDNGYIKKIESVLKNCGPDYSNKTWTTKEFNYQGFEENELNWRLDYIFSTKDIHVEDAKILRTNLSDHLPIMVEINI